jgi:DNA-binding SARP family transcriptional activator
LRKIGELRYAVGVRLARDLLRSGLAREALEVARELIDEDPYDEPARDISIRAHLALGEGAAALREYRHYRDLIRAELHAEPSPTIARLFAE